MYISFAWVPLSGDEAFLEAAVDDALESNGFVNIFKPMPRFVFANTPGNKKSRVDDLQTDLRRLPIRFAISATQRGWLMWRSVDVSLERCKRIADYDG